MVVLFIVGTCNYVDRNVIGVLLEQIKEADLRRMMNTNNIRLDPKVQVVINMDGWGPQWMKLDSYHDYVYLHPVQYTGFKIFYHNDTKKGGGLLTPEQVLKLIPKPVYIQYQ